MINELLIIVILISMVECFGQTCLKTFFHDETRINYFIGTVFFVTYY